MKTITFYSYKGGVGRTLALSNIANRLSEFGKKVFIIDFDLEAPGVPYKFKPFDIKQIKKGLVDLVSSYIDFGVIPETLSDYTYTLNTRGNITLLPAGNNSSREYWSSLAHIKWNDIFYNANSNGVQFFLGLKEKIRKDYEPDFLLIDSRTGISEIAGITISLFADELVLFFANNTESIEGTSHLIKSILSPNNQLINKSPKIHLALCRIPTDSEKNLSIRDDFMKEIVVSTLDRLLAPSSFKIPLSEIMIIHSDRELELQERFKIGFTSLTPIDSNFVNNEQLSISVDYLRLFERITMDVLSEEEVKRFNSLKTAEMLVEKANSTDDSGIKIEYLKSAIKYNNRYTDAYTQLASTFINLNNFSEAERHLNDLLQFRPEHPIAMFFYEHICYRTNRLNEALKYFNSIHHFAVSQKWIEPIVTAVAIYMKAKNPEKALQLCEELLKISPNSSQAFNTMANALRISGRYDEAIKYVQRAIELDPRNPIAYGTLGEINAHLNNPDQFYMFLELSLIFKIDFNRILTEEDIYKKFYNEPRFISLLDRYGFSVPERS